MTWYLAASGSSLSIVVAHPIVLTYHIRHHIARIVLDGAVLGVMPASMVRANKVCSITSPPEPVNHL